MSLARRLTTRVRDGKLGEGLPPYDLEDGKAQAVPQWYYPPIILAQAAHRHGAAVRNSTTHRGATAAGSRLACVQTQQATNHPQIRAGA
jgi:hypothetical protein